MAFIGIKNEESGDYTKYVGVELLNLYELNSYGEPDGYAKTVCNPETIQIFASLDEAKDWVEEDGWEGERAIYNPDVFPHRIM